MQDSNAYTNNSGAGIKYPNVSNLEKKPAMIDENRSPLEPFQDVKPFNKKALWTGVMGTAFIIALSKFGLKKTLSTLGMLSASSAAILPVIRKMTKNDKLPA